MEVVEKKFPQECSGNFMDQGWMLTMGKKLDYIIESIRECWGGVFVHSDCDVQFFGSFERDILEQLGDKDIVGQRELKADDMCCGFFICRANERTLSLFENIKLLVNEKKNDQIVLNEIKDKFVDWGVLDDKYLSVIHLLKNVPLWVPGVDIKLKRKDILVHHANWTVGVDNKRMLMCSVRNQVKLQKISSPTFLSTTGDKDCLLANDEFKKKENFADCILSNLGLR
jgi:DNA polymerase sigma